MKRVFRVDHPLNPFSLTPGQQYYVTVQGSNDAGGRPAALGMFQAGAASQMARMGWLFVVS